MKKFLKILGIILLVIVLLLALGLGYLTLVEYKPADQENVTPEGEASAAYHVGDTLTVVTWNVGYGALGDNADFFMDGGSMVQTADKERVQFNLAGITGQLTKMNADIILLQEVDANSSRSHGIDERAAILEGLKTADGVDRMTAFANNFKAFVPYPLPPIGSVDSGLYTLTTASMASAQRISLPCPFSWPIRVANLKRCLLVTRIPLEGSDRELVLVNLHLEAYDDGEGKVAQAKQLAEFLSSEVEKGNYVIAGGDFNQMFSDVDPDLYPTYEGNWQPGHIDVDEFAQAGVIALMDPSAPTCRSLLTPFADASREGFQFYMIDGFMVSANVQVSDLQTVETDFVWSDHNPVRMSVTLLP